MRIDYQDVNELRDAGFGINPACLRLRAKTLTPKPEILNPKSNRQTLNPKP